MEVQRALGHWTTSFREDPKNSPSFLAYMLEHEYTDANLQFTQLKGKDLLKVSFLKEANDFSVYLANLEKIVNVSCEEPGAYACGYDAEEEDDCDSDGSGSNSNASNSESFKLSDDYHEITNVFEEHLQLTRVVQLDGSELAEDILIKESDIVQRKPFARNPDEEDYIGYTGNEGDSTTYIYRNTVRCLVLDIYFSHNLSVGCTLDAPRVSYSISP
jgi:hypothetical protein